MDNNTTHSYERQPDQFGVVQQRRWVVANGTNTLRTYLTYQYPDLSQPESPAVNAELKTNVAKSMHVVDLANRYKTETMPQTDRDILAAQMSVARAHEIEMSDSHEFTLPA